MRVAGALDAGLALGRSTLDALATDLAGKTRSWPPSAWATPRSAGVPLALERLREQLGAQRGVAASAPAGRCC